MQNEDIFVPQHLKTTLLDLLKDDQRDLVWKLIDHYFNKAWRLDHFDVLGHVSLKAEKRDTYLKCAEYSYAMTLTPEERYKARTNLYKAYHALNRPEDALFYIEQNLLLKPDDFDALCQKAFNMALMGNKVDSEAFLEELLQKYPEKSKLLESSFSAKWLREGKTAKGIISFVEMFKPKNNLFDVLLKIKRWRGESISNTILYVDAEGGIGDMFINIRFFDHLYRLNIEPILVSPDTEYYQDINSIFKRHGYKVISNSIEIDTTKCWAPMLSLPGYLEVTEKDLWSGPYIRPIRNQKNKLQSKKFKIGIKCSGNPYFAQDEYRKIPIEQIIAVLPNDAEIYYIDKDPVYHSGIINLANRITTWDDTLDFIDQMDCIVSSCTSLVHAAGALGKTTFVAVPIAEYYIWTSTRTDSSTPWYGDNMHVFKQRKVRDWNEPLVSIGAKVKKLQKDMMK